MQNIPSYSSDRPLISDRSAFIRSTYIHLSVAIFAFIALSTGLMLSGVSDRALSMLYSSGKNSWLVVLGAFMLVSMLATRLADRSTSNAAQLTGLGIYVIAEALIFMPLFALANYISPQIIPAAGITTLLLVGGLTFTAFTSKKDFSFMGPFLAIAGFVSIGIIIASIIFGFSLGIVFSGVMVLLCGGFILYDTSKIIRYYPTDRPAGAALHLFASIATMLWYVLRIFMSRR